MEADCQEKTKNVQASKIRSPGLAKTALNEERLLHLATAYKEGKNWCCKKEGRSVKKQGFWINESILKSELCEKQNSIQFVPVMLDKRLVTS